MERRPLFAPLLACLLVGSGCAHVETAGDVIGVTGAVVFAVGASVASGCNLLDDSYDSYDSYDADEDECDEEDMKGADPEAGLPIAGVGVLLMGLGALTNSLSD